jgi:hypothetical protein
MRGAPQEAVTSRVGTIGTVTFAGLTREGATSRVVNLPFLEDAGLGLDLLRGTRLSVDYSGRRFWIAPSQCSGASRSVGGLFPKDRDDGQHQQRGHEEVKVPPAPLGAQIPAQHGAE